MKQLHTLCLTLCMLGVVSLVTAQQASNQDNKRVVIIKKQIDANGQQTVEKIIVTDGDEENVILQDIEAEVAVIGNLSEGEFFVHNTSGETSASEVNVNVDENNGEKIITIEVDGKTETLHLAKGETLSDEETQRLAEKGVFLNTSDNINWVGHDAHEGVFDINLKGLGKDLVYLSKGLAHLSDGNQSWAVSAYDDINCAALGVYVSTHNPEGVYISNIIGASGAQEAGIMRGDLIRAIDETPTADFPQLHDALSHYRPGDVVTVTYERDGVENRVETQLKAWKDLPSFANSRHALVTCDSKESEETVTRKIIVIKKDRVDDDALPETINENLVSIDNNLVLSEFVAFPNPTEGKFNVQFSGEPVPTIVSVYDASGKEIFRDSQDNFRGYYSREMDFSGQARGAVVLSVEQVGKTYTEQIVLH